MAINQRLGINNKARYYLTFESAKFQLNFYFYLIADDFFLFHRTETIPLGHSQFAYSGSKSEFFSISFKFV